MGEQTAFQSLTRVVVEGQSDKFPNFHKRSSLKGHQCLVLLMRPVAVVVVAVVVRPVAVESVVGLY